MTSEFNDVEPGDELWVINGQETSAFEANVVEVTDHHIMATMPEKSGTRAYLFNRDTGKAFIGGSQLAFDNDWRIKVILDRKEHGSWIEKVIKLAAEYRKDPTAENGYALTEAVENWRHFVTYQADPVALRVESVADYLVEKLVKTDGS
jgi:hypothetical protein